MRYPVFFYQPLVSRCPELLRHPPGSDFPLQRQTRIREVLDFFSSFLSDEEDIFCILPLLSFPETEVFFSEKEREKMERPEEPQRGESQGPKQCIQYRGVCCMHSGKAFPFH